MIVRGIIGEGSTVHSPIWGPGVGAYIDEATSLLLERVPEGHGHLAGLGIPHDLQRGGGPPCRIAAVRSGGKSARACLRVVCGGATPGRNTTAAANRSTADGAPTGSHGGIESATIVTQRWACLNCGDKSPVWGMAREAPRRPHLPPDTGTLRMRLLRELPVLNAAGGYARVLLLSVSPDVHGGAYGGGLPCLGGAPSCPCTGERRRAAASTRVRPWFNPWSGARGNGKQSLRCSNASKGGGGTREGEGNLTPQPPQQKKRLKSQSDFRSP